MSDIVGWTDGFVLRLDSKMKIIEPWLYLIMTLLFQIVLLCVCWSCVE